METEAKLEPVVIRQSRSKVLVLLGASAALAGAGIFILTRDPASAVGWLAALFFSTCAIVFAIQLTDSRPRIVIDDEGVLDRTLGVGVIPWSEIRAMELRSIGRQEFVSLDLQHPERFAPRLRPLLRLTARMNQALGFTAFNVNASGLPMSGAELMELLTKHREVHRPR